MLWTASNSPYFMLYFIFLVGIVHVVLLISRSPNEITISEQLKRYLLLPLLFSFLVSFFSSTETEIEIENWEIASMSVETPILAHASRVQSSCTWANNCCVVYVCVFFCFCVVCRQIGKVPWERDRKKCADILRDLLLKKAVYEYWW